MNLKRSPQIEKSLNRLRTRLAFANAGVHSSVLIPVGFMSLLLIYSLLESNPRIHSLSTPLTLEGETSRSTALWFSISLKDDNILVKSTDGMKFQLNVNNLETGPFVSYLKSRKSKLVKDVALANLHDNNSALVVLSVDEHLTFAHVRPVIYALAKVGITRYGFEGRVLER